MYIPLANKGRIIFAIFKKGLTPIMFNQSRSVF